jgi:hypothetical protein
LLANQSFFPHRSEIKELENKKRQRRKKREQREKREKKEQEERMQMLTQNPQLFMMMQNGQMPQYNTQGSPQQGYQSQGHYPNYAPGPQPDQSGNPYAPRDGGSQRGGGR